MERSGESSRTTHGAPTTVDACRYLGALIAGAVNGAGKEELLSERYAPVPRYWDRRPLVAEIDEVASGSFKTREPPEIRSSGYVVRSLEAALWAFHKGDSFREGALLAVNLGDDADTTGAVYGQLAGAYYGEGGIPEPWRLRLAHRLLIEHFAERLFALGPIVDWGKLLAYLPPLERPASSPGKVPGFLEALYDSGAVHQFDWASWHGEAERLFEDPATLAAADEETLRKLLTFHARKDRFSEGHLDRMIETGHVAAILRRLEEVRGRR